MTADRDELAAVYREEFEAAVRRLTLLLREAADEIDHLAIRPAGDALPSYTAAAAEIADLVTGCLGTGNPLGGIVRRGREADARLRAFT